MINESKKNTDIEALRAVGIIFVLIAHTYKIFPWFKFDSGGFSNIYVYFGWWTGVDLFFCISGFIITSKIINEIPDGTTTRDFLKFAAPFWVKRIFRLWPAAWFWLTITVVGSIWFNQSGVFGKTINAIMYQAYAVLNLANVYGFECTKNLSCGVNQVYWSLSLEEQFYWILPFVLFFIRGKWLVYILATVALIQIPLDRGSQFIGFIRTDALAIGCLLGIAFNKDWYLLLKPTILNKKSTAWAVSFSLTLLLGIIGTWKNVLVPFNTGIVAIISGILVWIGSYNSNYIIPGKLQFITNYLGSRSYSLYLAHIPAYYIAVELMHRYNKHHENMMYGNYICYWLVAISMTFLCAEFSYRAIETPLRKKGRFYSKNLKDRF